MAALQVTEMLGVMTCQLRWLWPVAQQHMPALLTNSNLPTAALAIAEDSVAAAHATVQAFLDLCR